MGAPPFALRKSKSRRLLTGAAIALAAAGLAASVGCSRPQPETAPRELAMGWRPVLSQSGRGTIQTESFQIDTGQWRIKWSAAAEAGRTVEDGIFRIGVHSAVSGRLMSVAVDGPGAGAGTAYVAEEPRPFFLSIESSGLDWTIQVEEGLLGKRQENSSNSTRR